MVQMSGHRGIKHGPSLSLTGASIVATELGRLRQSEATYKAKIKSLEVEVGTLKGRLDGLRRAKNTTIVRREREEIHISSPNFNRSQTTIQSVDRSPVHLGVKPHPPQQCCHGDLLEQMKEINSQVGHLNSQVLSERARYDKLREEAARTHGSELAGMKQTHEEQSSQLAAELEQLKGEREKANETSKDFQSLQSELNRLRTENSDLSSHLDEVLASNEALQEGSILLQEKSQALLEELSIKEAEWSQREDRLKEEIRQQWGERYHDWMTKAEKKMEELQQINILLQSMLKTKKDNDL